MRELPRFHHGPTSSFLHYWQIKIPPPMNDSSEYALLELCEQFHIATVGAPWFTVTLEGGINNSRVEQQAISCMVAVLSPAANKIE